jgi:hypothetical protein
LEFFDFKNISCTYKDLGLRTESGVYKNLQKKYNDLAQRYNNISKKEYDTKLAQYKKLYDKEKRNIDNHF